MKKKKNISDITLKLINIKKIKPIPKWEFIAKNFGIWSGFLISILVLILGISITWFGLIDNIITPYLWIFIVIIFFVLSFLFFQKTKGAYHFYKWQIILPIVISTLFIGGFFFKFGFASKIDRNLESKFSYYRNIVPMRMIVWNNPSSGYLSGKITKIIDQNNFTIIDFNNKLWQITGNNILIRNRVDFSIDSEIKIIGTKINDSIFNAEEIRPWNGMGQNMMKENY